MSMPKNYSTPEAAKLIGVSPHNPASLAGGTEDSALRNRIGRRAQAVAIE